MTLAQIEANRQAIKERDRMSAIEVNRANALNEPLLQELNKCEARIIELEQQKAELLDALQFAKTAMTAGRESGLPCRWDGFATAVWKIDRAITEAKP